MKFPPAPIRFLLLVVGGWVAIRAAAILPPSAGDPGGMVADSAGAGPSASSRGGLLTGTAFATVPAKPARSVEPLVRLATWPDDAWAGAQSRPRPASNARQANAIIASHPDSSPRLVIEEIRQPQLQDTRFRAPAAAVQPPLLMVPRRPASSGSRLSGSAWLFVRDRGAPSLAQGGTLGGSQAGARLTYRLNGDTRRPVSLSGRLYTPLDRPAGAEAALGIDWRPIAGLPVNLLAERRQRIGREGRSDFALTVYGGIERHVLRDRVRIEAYAQTGIVGVEARDLFADGQVIATTRIGPIDVGGGAWGGAQPGAARLDLGPHASFRLPVGRATIRAAAEWRFRVAGDAAPGSGPALTIATGF